MYTNILLATLLVIQLTHGSVDAVPLNSELTQYINEQINLGLTQAKREVINQMEGFVSSHASGNRQGCQSGVFGEHAYPEMKFPASAYITFNPPFTATPALVYGLYLYDSSKNTNSRLVTSVSNLSKSGFNLKISTFAGTKMWGARISWMACPKSFEN
ncbi:uncharacterized protein LOC143046218 [Mytilus galloprovincialis]|uniref:uncharacterized protein LOC143046218 n=1 Tax=Mytilus galloprovincialis TaxID=29158 RepID=UPI003F7B4F6C